MTETTLYDKGGVKLVLFRLNPTSADLIMTVEKDKLYTWNNDGEGLGWQCGVSTCLNNSCIPQLADIANAFAVAATILTLPR